MLTQRSTTATVERVLLYLERRLQVAEHYGRRWDSSAYEAAWLLVFECYYGASPRAILQVVPSPSLTNTPLNADKPWFREKYARPLQRVVRNIEYTVPAHDGQPETRWFDQVLACGHRIEMQYDHDGAKRPKHRRCAECVEVTTESSHGSASGSANPVQRPAVPSRHLPQLPLRDANAAERPVSMGGDSHTRMFAVPRRNDNTETHCGQCGPIGAA